MKLTESVLERSDARIHYWTGGEKDAPLVVFTHGAYADHHEWDKNLEPVLDAGFRILAWDLRGHGRSRPSPFDIVDACDDLMGILDSLKVSQTVLVGHSLGCNLNQEFIFHHPERIAAAVMLDCTWNFYKMSWIDSMSIKIGVPLLNILPYKMLVDQGPKMISTIPSTQALIHAGMEAITKKEFIHILIETLNCLRYKPDYHIGKPLLLMIGEKSNIFNFRRSMTSWSENEPYCEFLIVPGVRHAGNLDAPEFFNDRLLEFLKRQRTQDHHSWMTMEK